MKKLILLALIILMGCMPTVTDTATPDVTPTPESEWLNDNPNLEYGGCETVMFRNSQDKLEFIPQCWPDGYELYQTVVNYPIRIKYTGDAYSTRPLNTYGSIGYRLPPMTLAPGQYIIKVYGDAHMWGLAEDYALLAHCSIEGVPGVIMLGADDLSANGSYTAMFTLNAPQAGVYNCAVYLRILHPSMTADSFMTFKKITVEFIE